MGSCYQSFYNGLFCPEPPCFLSSGSNPNLSFLPVDVTTHRTKAKPNTYVFILDFLCCIDVLLKYFISVGYIQTRDTSIPISDENQSEIKGHILLVDNYFILSLKSTRELSNCRPLEFVQSVHM